MNNDAIYTWATYRVLDCQAAGVNIKASPGQVGGFHIFNSAGSTRYVKLYDKATAPASTDTPLQTIPIPAGVAISHFQNCGIDFQNGIGIRCTTGVADNDTGAPTTNDVQVNLLYR